MASSSRLPGTVADIALAAAAIGMMPSLAALFVLIR
jgi:hypothetical protein